MSLAAHEPLEKAAVTRRRRWRWRGGGWRGCSGRRGLGRRCRRGRLGLFLASVRRWRRGPLRSPRAAEPGGGTVPRGMVPVGLVLVSLALLATTLLVLPSLPVLPALLLLEPYKLDARGRSVGVFDVGHEPLIQRAVGAEAMSLPGECSC